jgi:hypothetical protein
MGIAEHARKRRSKIQGPSSDSIPAKALVGMIGCWVWSVGLVGRVTSGWLETRKFTFSIPILLGVDDEPGGNAFS